MDQNDGYEYIGTFKNDKRHGLRGTCFYSNGDFYSGPWLNDLHDSSLIKLLSVCKTPTYNSPGHSFTNAILIKNDGEYRFIGQFNQGSFHGNGLEYQEHQASIGVQVNIFTGKFQNGERHGKGML